MYERYYGLAEKPFSLTPDPRYLYRSGSHAGAFELLRYAVRRREGFVVVTGDIGTGKTTLCRALLEQIDRSTYTALVLNPFLSEEDLLRRILQDFGVVSRDDVRRRGRLADAGKDELIDFLYDFLLGLAEQGASAVVIIDEAQNLSPRVLEQVRILSNLETDKEKLLQIILVGQLNLSDVLAAPDMRQLHQRVSVRYQLAPLDAKAVASYVPHRMAIAGAGQANVTFSKGALDRIHRLSGGIPRVINMICDRALAAGCSAQTDRIMAEHVAHAARSLNLPPERRRWLPGAAVAAALVLALGLTAAAGQSWARRDELTAPAGAPALDAGRPRSDAADRRLPAEAAVTILTGSYPAADPASARSIRALTDWLEASGFAVYYAEVDLGSRGRWRRVLAGAYTDRDEARRQAARLNQAAPRLDAVVVTALFATASRHDT